MLSAGPRLTQKGCCR